MIEVAIGVGHMAGIYWKAKYATPRPAQVYPALLTTVPAPPHPSFPSNHALQNALICLCLEKALPAAVAEALRGLIAALALRIAENRKFAGVHYPSDTIASLQILAPKVFAVLIKADEQLKKETTACEALCVAVAAEWPVSAESASIRPDRSGEAIPLPLRQPPPEAAAKPAEGAAKRPPRPIPSAVRWPPTGSSRRQRRYCAFVPCQSPVSTNGISLNAKRPLGLAFPIYSTSGCGNNWLDAMLSDGAVTFPDGVDPDHDALSGHAVCVIGVVCDENAAGNGWIIFHNSVGPAFPRRAVPGMTDFGYGRMSLADANRHAWDLFTLRPAGKSYQR